MSVFLNGKSWGGTFDNYPQCRHEDTRLAIVASWEEQYGFSEYGIKASIHLDS